MGAPRSNNWVISPRHEHGRRVQACGAKSKKKTLNVAVEFKGERIYNAPRANFAGITWQIVLGEWIIASIKCSSSPRQSRREGYPSPNCASLVLDVPKTTLHGVRYSRAQRWISPRIMASAQTMRTRLQCVFRAELVYRSICTVHSAIA